AAEKFVISEKQGAVLAFFYRNIARSHFANGATGFNQTRLLGHFASFAVVQNQKIYLWEERVEIITRGLDPEIHRVRNDKARHLHLLQNVHLKSRSNVGQQNEIGLAI